MLLLGCRLSAPGAFPRYVYQLRGHSLGPPHAREPWQMPPKADAQAMPPNLASDFDVDFDVDFIFLMRAVC